jgi:peptide/nickel transport system substrate-binding protein
VETGAFIQSVTAGKEAFFMLGWSGDYPDASNFYEFHFTGASMNFGNPYPELKKAVIAGGSTADPAQRETQYNEANRLIKALVPLIPIAHGVSGLAFNVGVQNVNIGPLNENFDEMSNNADRLVFMQSSEPTSLWPGDETYGDTLRPATLLYDTLLGYEYGGFGVKPSLAEYWETNKDATQWTFYLRRGVRFSDLQILDANDVVASFAAQWDASSPNHTGSTGAFEYFAGFFGDFINKK